MFKLEKAIERVIQNFQFLRQIVPTLQCLIISKLSSLRNNLKFDMFCMGCSCSAHDLTVNERPSQNVSTYVYRRRYRYSGHEALLAAIAL